MKIISLIGARPQFIKEAALNPLFDKYGIDETLVNSGQHYDANLSDVFFQNLNMKEADFNLNVGSSSHAKMTADIMVKFEKIVKEVAPDIVLVYGDTNTTLAGALVARKLKINLAHIEAGLRMKPNDMPEEINRVAVDHLSTHLFAPSKMCVNNLKNESLCENVFLTGDVMYDLFLKMRPNFNYNLIDQLELKNKSFILSTFHRDYNVDDPKSLEDILIGINKIANQTTVLLPIHPRTKKNIEDHHLEKYLKNVLVIEPIGYLEMMGLLMNCSYVITDSGGLQKEAYFAGKRALVMMPDAAWKELVEVDWNILTTPANLLNDANKINLTKKHNIPDNIYGDGHSAEKILEALLK